MKRALAWAALLWTSAASAQQLDQIPDMVMEDKPEAPPARGGDQTFSAKAFLDVAPQATLWRDVKAVPVPLSSYDRSRWSGWSSGDLRAEWRPMDKVRIIVSDRLDQTYQDDSTPSTHQMRNSWREGYVGLAPADGWFVDLGRVNDKEGVATGYNPTDFFKRQAVLVRQNADPAALRDTRLGAIMARGQKVWDGGSVTALVSPALTSDKGALDDSVFNPGLDRTNRTTRSLLKGSLRLAEDVIPEVLLFDEDGKPPLFGVNLTRGFGDRVVTWAEWSGGRRPDVISTALTDGLRTGLFPANTSAPLAHDSSQGFRNQATIGSSLSFENKLTLTLEGHYNQLGLSPAQWRAWFAKGQAVPQLDAILWQMRQNAQDQGEPISRTQLFARADWTDFPVKDMELSGFTVIAPSDGSAYVQLEQDYYLNPVTTLGLRASASLGNQTSEWGSIPSSFSALARVVRYF